METCEGRALKVAKAVLPSRSPPGHAWCIRTERADVNCLRLFRWREKRGNLPWRKLAFPRARQRRGVDGPVVCDTAEARRTIKYVGLVSFRCKSEQYRKTNNINKRRLMGQPCKSALIYTKVFRLETPGEFFKDHLIRQNFRQIPSPGVARGRADVPLRSSYMQM